MTASVIALFGESQKGELETAYYCQSLGDLFESLGEPPSDTHGLFFAVQSLLFGQEVIYFRVREEGISLDDYQSGLSRLQRFSTSIIRLKALFLPGVGSREILDEGFTLCRKQKSLLIVREADFYDYMTDSSKYMQSA